MCYETPISVIEREIRDCLEGKADCVYVNNAPQAVAEPQRSYIVANVGGSIHYHGAYKQSHCYIYVYVKNKESGVQDSLELDRVTNAVLGCFPLESEHIVLLAPSVNYGARAGNYTRAIIRLRMIIK